MLADFPPDPEHSDEIGFDQGFCDVSHEHLCGSNEGGTRLYEIGQRITTLTCYAVKLSSGQTSGLMEGWQTKTRSRTAFLYLRLWIIETKHNRQETRFGVQFFVEFSPLVTLTDQLRLLTGLPSAMTLNSSTCFFFKTSLRTTTICILWTVSVLGSAIKENALVTPNSIRSFKRWKQSYRFVTGIRHREHKRLSYYTSFEAEILLSNTIVTSR